MSVAVLSRANGISTNAFALDNVQRIVVWLAKIWAESLLPSSTLRQYLEDLVYKLNEGRTLDRFLQMPLYIEGALTDEAWSKADTPERMMCIMNWSMFIYYPAEHLYYLSTLSPKLRWHHWVDGDLCVRLSYQSWFGYNVAAILREYLLIAREGTRLSICEVSEEQAALRRSIHRRWLWLSCIVAEMPACVHWSFVGGVGLGTRAMGVLALYPAIVSLWLHWLRALEAARSP